MRIVCISDTHGKHSELIMPEGDILLHAGDISPRGKIAEVQDFNQWLGTLSYPHKVIIAGNHDFIFEKNPVLAQSLITNALYLEDESIVIGGLKIWGSPITPWFYDWAFNRQRGGEIREYWEMIPKDTDILITHGPPAGILDKTIGGDSAGCADLLEIVQELKPRVHLFGHIHEAAGTFKTIDTQFINASVLNLKYQMTNDPLVIDL